MYCEMGKRRTGSEADGTKHEEAGKLREGISLQHVSKRLGGVSVLSGINLHVEAGECAVLVGRNGSGKVPCCAPWQDSWFLIMAWCIRR